jgi:hypothetical protein
MLVGVADPLSAGLSYVNQGWAAGVLALLSVGGHEQIVISLRVDDEKVSLAIEVECSHGRERSRRNTERVSRKYRSKTHISIGSFNVS